MSAIFKHARKRKEREPYHEAVVMRRCRRIINSRPQRFEAARAAAYLEGYERWKQSMDYREQTLANCRAAVEESKKPGMYTPDDREVWRAEYYNTCGPKTMELLLDWIDELRAST